MRNLVLVLILATFIIHAEEEKPTVALMNFRGNNIDSSEIASLSNRFLSELFVLNTYKLIERSEMDRILLEQGFQQTGCTDQACAVEVGQLLNVHFIIVGTFDRVGEVYTLNIRKVSVKTGEIVATVMEDCQACSLEKLYLQTVKNAARKLCGIEPVTQKTDSEQISPPKYKTNAFRIAFGINMNSQPLRSKNIRFRFGEGTGILVDSFQMPKSAVSFPLNMHMGYQLAKNYFGVRAMLWIFGTKTEEKKISSQGVDNSYNLITRNDMGGLFAEYSRTVFLRKRYSVELGINAGYLYSFYSNYIDKESMVLVMTDNHEEYPDLDPDGAQLHYTEGFLFGGPVLRVSTGYRRVRLSFEYGTLLGQVKYTSGYDYKTHFGLHHRLSTMVDILIGRVAPQ